MSRQVVGQTEVADDVTSESDAIELQLPHPESYETAARVRQAIIGNRERRVLDVDVSYSVFRPTADLSEPGLYDEHGVVYVSAGLIELNPTFADLVAFHETVEIQQKRQGVWHGEAHRRAYVQELVAAKAMLSATDLAGYVRWRIALYPKWKALNVEKCVAELLSAIEEESSERERLYESIKAHNL